MKKLILGLIATVMFAGTSYAQKTEVKTEGRPLIEFEFGRKSKNCGGFGICILRINISPELGAEIIQALLLPGGVLKVAMPPKFYKDHASAFQNGYLVVEEDYVIDRETTKAIGLKDNYTIKTGKYKVEFDKNSNTYNCTF